MGTIKKEWFGNTEGRDVYAYTMENSKGMKAKIITYGGAIAELWVPDRNGRLGDIVLGFDNLEAYLESTEYIGVTIGRFCNRIAKGHFVLDGKEYQMCINDKGGHLHGGPKGLARKVWDDSAEIIGDDLCVHLSVFSPDGEENYPGNLKLTVTYTVTENNEFKLRYVAETDKRTIVNFTNHVFFNLDGYAAGDILSHELFVDADRYNEINEENVPDGVLAPVEGTPFDFRVPKEIGRDMDMTNPQLSMASGYDHNMIFNDPRLTNKSAEVYSKRTGRVLSLYTDQPGMQLYIGNYLREDIPFKGGVPHRLRHGFCLETQSMPDSPNHDNFTNVVLSPGEVFDRTTVYAFSTR